MKGCKPLFGGDFGRLFGSGGDLQGSAGIRIWVMKMKIQPQNDRSHCNGGRPKKQNVPGTGIGVEFLFASREVLGKLTQRFRMRFEAHPFQSE
jgi:hypothetical protein